MGLCRPIHPLGTTAGRFSAVRTGSPVCRVWVPLPDPEDPLQRRTNVSSQALWSDLAIASARPVTNVNVFGLSTATQELPNMTRTSKEGVRAR